MMKISLKMFAFLVLTGFIVQMRLYADEVIVLSQQKKTMITEKMEIDKIYKAEGNEEFLRNVLAGTMFCGGLYSCFDFKKDHTFTLKFDDYQENEKFTEKGTWDVKEGYLILKFSGNHSKWKTHYKLDVYILGFNSEKKRYSLVIHIKDKTPWNDQALGLDFN